MTDDHNEAKIIEEPPHDAKRRMALVALLALAAITFFFGLGQLYLVGPDEPRYAEVAREMFVSGDWVTTRLAGCLWFEKPVLLYWMAAGAYYLFGVGEFAARFPSAAGALIVVLFLFIALKRVVSVKLAWIAAFVLATSGIFIAFARSVTTDMVLTCALSVALLAGFLFTVTSGRARKLFWVMCWAMTGAAMLAKGLVGVFFVVAILGLHLIATGRWRELRWPDCLVGIAVFLLVSSSWYLPVTLAHGRAFIDEFFIEHHFQRYLTAQHHHPQPFYFYLFIALAGVLPWTFFLLPASARLRRLRPRSNVKDSLLLFSWIWVLLPLLFFSFSESKLPGYLLPVFPALAIIVAVEVEEFLSVAPSRLQIIGGWLTAMLLLVIGVAFVIFLRREGVSIIGWNGALSGLPISVSLLATGCMVARRRRAVIGMTALVVVSVVVGTVGLAFVKLNERLSLHDLSVEVAQSLRPGEKVGFFIMKEFAPVFYTEGRVLCGTGDGTLFNALHEDRVAEVLATESSLILFTSADWIARLENDARLSTERLGSQRRAIAVRVALRKP